jgi:hypothetical protein
VWADIEAATDLFEPDGIVACNHIGIVFPGVLDGWATLHGDEFGVWSALREARGLPPHKAMYGHEGLPHATRREDVQFTDFRLPGQVNNGSSGLFAGKVALFDLGFERIVFCGVPMLDLPHFHSSHGFPHAPTHRAGWLEALPYLKDRARSMSGWSMELLGAPTPEWLSAAS